MVSNTSKIRKIGNSQGLILDKSILDELGLVNGSVVNLLLDEGYLTVKPVATQTVPTIGIAEGEKVADDVCFSAEADEEIAAMMGAL